MASKILKSATTFESLALLGSMTKKKNKKIKFKNPIESTSTILLGIPLIKATGGKI